MPYVSKLSERQKSYWLILALGLIWVLFISLAHKSPPLDNMEELVWASSFEWGYDKHPPMPSWLLYPVVLLFGKHAWLTYLLAKLSEFFALCIIWDLYKRILDRAGQPLPAYAGLVAILVGALSLYHTIRSQDYNHNTAQFWSIAGIYWAYYLAWRAEGLKYWLYTTLFALFVAAALLTKYSVVVQLAGLAIHFLYAGRWRQAREWYGVAYVFVLASLLFAPHVFWVLSHSGDGHGPIGYLMHSVSGASPAWYEVYANIGSFFLIQVSRELPYLAALTLIYLIYRQDLKKQKSIWSAIEATDRSFILIAALAPTILSISGALVLQAHLKSSWGATFFMLYGAFVWLVLPKDGHFSKLISGICMAQILTALAFALVTGPVADMSGRSARSVFPGKELSRVVLQRWHENNELVKDRKLEVIAGDVWFAGNAAVNANDADIKVLIEGDPGLSPWLKGDVFSQPLMVVIDRGEDGRRTGSEKLEQLFSRAQVRGRESIPWTRKADGPHQVFDWGIMLPQ